MKLRPSFDEPIEPWRLWVLTIGCVWMAACAIALAILGNWWLGISNGALAVMFGWQALMYHRARRLHPGEARK